MNSRGDEDMIKTTQKQPIEAVPDDIVLLIFEKLGNWIDRFRARTVCKKWFQVQMTRIPNQGEFPWLFRHKLIYGDRKVPGCNVKLLDEYSKKSYVIDQYSGKQLNGAQICASKFGWILMRKREKQTIEIIKFFVYCPFNSKFMNLPTVNSPAHSIGHFTYSSDPTSPDCVFFAVIANSEWIEISTCRIQDKEWKKFQLFFSIPYIRPSVECINGLLYVVLLRAKYVEGADPVINSHVGTLDHECQEWKWIKNENGFMMNNNGKYVHPFITRWHLHPVVYNNKELYLLFRTERDGLWDFYKYDMEQNQWVDQPSLGDRVLFIGGYGSSFLVDAVGKLSCLANNAFSTTGGLPCYPYSFSSRKIEYHRNFYADDRKLEDRSFYNGAWIIPSIS